MKVRLAAKRHNSPLGFKSHCDVCKEKKSPHDLIRHGHAHASFVCKTCKSHVNRLQRFGLTPEAFTKMLEIQRGRCAICESELKFVGNQSAVDHCHKSHVIRGILCRACNTAIALLKENDRHFRRAMQYLSDAQTKGVQPEKVRGVYGYIRDWYAQKASTKDKTKAGRR